MILVTAEKKQYLCGRAVVVFFIGIWSSLKNSIDFAKFVGETGIFVGIFKIIP